MIEGSSPIKKAVLDSVVDLHWFQCLSGSSFFSQCGSRSGSGSREPNQCGTGYRLPVHENYTCSWEWVKIITMKVQKPFKRQETMFIWSFRSISMLLDLNPDPHSQYGYGSRSGSSKLVLDRLGLTYFPFFGRQKSGSRSGSGSLKALIRIRTRWIHARIRSTALMIFTPFIYS